jgi:single-stranded-DNA-specific exonuclease
MLPRLNKRWMIYEKIPAEIDQTLAFYPPFFRQILFARGIGSEVEARLFLEGGVERCDPFQLTDMEKLVDRLSRAIDDLEFIAVYGDYDVDGVTATALLTQVLKRYGAEVMHYIPHRFDEGYGLNIEALDALKEQGVKLVVTVDCGIRSPREAEYAQKLGIDLIISDHHSPGEEFPEALAVICPKRAGDLYPDKDLSGVGLAYKIAQALELRRPKDEVSADDWLDLVALGTVADVVPLQGENRTLVRRGLQRLRTGRRPGLVSLSNVAGMQPLKASAGDIAFLLGPRLNAAGRLDTAMDSLRLLMCEDIMQAGMLAQQLDNQNRQRQELTVQMQKEALRNAEEYGAEALLFAFSPGFNSGIVGLVASRLVDIYYRPAIVGYDDVKNGVTRASCRSIPEFHITQALDECSGLLVRHGGHALAAGFTVKNEDRPELIRRLREIASNQLDGRDLKPALHADLEIPLRDLRPDFLPYLDMLQPTGQANPEAIFVSRNLHITKFRKVGNEGQHLRLTVSDKGIYYDGIAFRQGHRAESLPSMVDMMYVFERNEFNGKVSLQLNVRDFKESGMPD